MSADQDSGTVSTEVADLQLQIQDLQGQLSELESRAKAFWELLILIGSRLQLSSTSIKMAVSSLLDYDIFWDPSTSYEFLQVIDTSTDRTADLVVLLTLAFRSESKSLEISTEPQIIQEVLESLNKRISKRDIEARLVVDYPPDGKPALVDYQYLIVALSLLFEVVNSETNNLEELVFQVSETPENWQLRIGDLDAQMVDIIKHFLSCPNSFEEFAGQLVPENELKLMVACRILRLQEIELVKAPSGQGNSLYLTIPAANMID